MDTAVWLAIVSSCAVIAGTILGAWLTNRLSRNQRRQIWLRDFDRFEAQRLISLFEDIVLDVQRRVRIDEERLDRLTARSLLLRYLTEPYQSKIQQLKQVCFRHRDALIKSESSTTGLSQEEESSREEILKLVSDLVDDIRARFSEQ